MGASRLSAVETLELTSPTLERTLTVAAAVAQQARPGDLIGLIGELGAGKTQFVRGLAAGLGIDPDQVSSPTFVLMQEYDPPPKTGPEAFDVPVLVHIDAYRLQSAEELATIGWHGSGEELRHGAVVAVEWADRVGEATGADWLEIRLEHADEGRRLTLQPHGDWVARMRVLRTALTAEDA